jgi:hypothetical protein
LLLISCGKKEGSSPQQPQFTNMKDYVQNKCSMCHSFLLVSQKARKPEELTRIVRRMGKCNPRFLDAEDQQNTLDYLITNEFVTGEGESTPKGEVDTNKE